MNIASYIRTISDFPKPGIEFYDISTLMAAPEAWKHAILSLVPKVLAKQPDKLAAIEARGFLVAAALGMHLDMGIIMLRKKGKLPGKTIQAEYALEYGTSVLQMQVDAVTPGERIFVIDDLLGTGGTLNAAIELITQGGGEVCGAACIMELSFLQGKKNVAIDVDTLVVYDK